jgi:hypothetical protein
VIDRARAEMRTLAVRLRIVVIATLISAMPRAAFACPVCFGDTNSPLASATNAGILAMLVVVAGVLISFASFFIYLMRRARLANMQHDPVEAGRRAGPAEAGPYQQGEGTAQC